MADITAQGRQESWFALLPLARPFMVQGGAGASTKVQLSWRWSNRAEARPSMAAPVPFCAVRCCTEGRDELLKEQAHKLGISEAELARRALCEFLSERSPRAFPAWRHFARSSSACKPFLIISNYAMPVRGGENHSRLLLVATS